MSNDNNHLFESVENHIDGSSESNLTKDPQFQQELAFRTRIQSDWNRAKKFESIKNQVKSVHMQQKTPNQTKRFLSYAAAACLIILLSIPGYQYFTKPDGKSLEIDQSEVKSSVIFFDTRYKQISPINGQLFGDESILFEWDTALDVKTSLIITNTETGSIVFAQPINSEVKQFKLTEYLGKGKYSWRLEGFTGEMVFVMK